MREEDWQGLVVAALADHLKVARESFFHEVQVHEGSIADVVAVVQKRLVVFELKMAELGQTSAKLGARGQRQLRHFKAAAHDVWIVTVAAPRQLELAYDGRIIVHEPLEAQLLPEGVGWMVFDVLSRRVVVMRPPGLSPPPPDIGNLITRLDSRMARVQRELKWCRATN